MVCTHVVPVGVYRVLCGHTDMCGVFGRGPTNLPVAARVFVNKKILTYEITEHHEGKLAARLNSTSPEIAATPVSTPWAIIEIQAVGLQKLTPSLLPQVAWSMARQM